MDTPLRQDLSRRHLLALGGGALAVGAFGSTVLSGCSPASGGSGGGLNMNSFGGSFTVAQSAAVNKGFQTKTGLRISTVVNSPIDVYNQLHQKHGDAKLDFALADQPFADQIIKDGNATAIDAAKVPSLQDLPDWAKDPNGKWAATFYNLIGIAYRPDKVKNPPKSWADLWSSEYAGHVALCTAAHTAGFLFLIEAARLNGGSEKNIDPGFKALARLKPHIKAFYETATQMGTLLTSGGDVWLGPYYMDQTLALKKKGAPIDFVLPSEGGLTDLGAAVIPSGSKNVGAALKYLDYFLSTEVQTDFANTATLLPTNSKATLPSKALSLADEHALRNPLVPDATYVADQLQDWITRFSSEIQN